MDKLLLHSLKCLAVMLCWLSIPQTANSQELSKRITLKQEQATIENLLQAIEKQTQYKFLYRKDLIDTSKRLTYSCSEKVLAEVLNELLPRWGLSYRV